MTKKYEIFRFGKEGIPDGLRDRLTIPSHIQQDGHPLSPFVEDRLIPEDLDLVLLEDLNGFYKRLTGKENDPFAFVRFCAGLYVAEDHIWTPQENFVRINAALREEYSLAVSRALLLPQERIDYWTLIHESLHDVFNSMPPELRAKIIESAIGSYDKYQKLSDMLDMTPFDILSFYWDEDEVARIDNEIDRLGLDEADAFADFHTFGNLRPVDQLYAADEFISNFFANQRVRNRHDPQYLPASFKETLMDVGYKVDTAPEVKR